MDFHVCMSSYVVLCGGSNGVLGFNNGCVWVEF